MFRLGFLETIAEVIGICPVGVHKINGDIDDDSVIWDRIVHIQPVDVIMPDKHNVIRLQFIGFPFDNIVDISFEENGNLVKVMIVVRHLSGFLVCQME